LVADLKKAVKALLKAMQRQSTT